MVEEIAEATIGVDWKRGIGEVSGLELQSGVKE